MMETCSKTLRTIEDIYIYVFFMVDPLDMAHERHMKGIEQINHDTPCESEILVKSLQLTL